MYIILALLLSSLTAPLPSFPRPRPTTLTTTSAPTRSDHHRRSPTTPLQETWKHCHADWSNSKCRWSSAWNATHAASLRNAPLHTSLACAAGSVTKIFKILKRECSKVLRFFKNFGAIIHLQQFTILLFQQVLGSLALWLLRWGREGRGSQVTEAHLHGRSS